MKKHSLVILVLSSVLGNVASRDLHPVKPEPGECFDTYLDVQPINLSKLSKACVERLPTKNECYGMKLTTDEILIVKCHDGNEQLEKGCYKFFDRDLKMSVICQKYVERNMCEIIKTPANLAVEVYCDKSEPGIIMVKKLKVAV